MRIRNHKHLGFRTFLIIALTLSPVTFLGIYVAKVNQLYDEMVSFTYEIPPDESSFQLANYSRFNEMAAFYDYRYENYHIPLNLSVDTSFTDVDCKTVNAYYPSDNCGQWTGLAITAWVFKYVTAKNEGNTELLENATRVVRKLLTGMSYLLIVPNGGLGPEYGGILARSYWSPEYASLNMQGANPLFEDPRHFNGTGDYSQWRWRAFTSLDEYSGFYSGMALILKFVDVPDIQNLVKIMIDQVADYMIDMNFLGIDWHGGPTGVDQKPKFFQGGTWICLLLKMAAIAYPEKYERIYYHYAVEEMYSYWTLEGGDHESVANYYSLAFSYHIVFSLLMLEDQPSALHDLYLSKFEQSLWSYTKYHRNPFYNIIRLITSYEPGENVVLEKDVEDQLMRYDCEYHFPDRALGVKDISTDTSYELVDNIEELAEFLTESPHGSIYLPIFGEVDSDEGYYNKPVTCEYLRGNIFIWEKNPYQEQTIPSYNAKYEYASFSFSLIYWMGRAYGFMADSGMRSA